MGDDADTSDPSYDSKASKRALFKDALSRTRSKFKKHESTEQDFKLSDDVNEFLAAGRTSVSSGQSQNRPIQQEPSPNSSPRIRPPPSPRGIPVPRLDVSQSSRFPDARPVLLDPRAKSHEYLGPYDYEPAGRTRSLSSFKKSRTRGRNLTVHFVSAPPIVIGEGGDEAENPVLEISRARQRARSLSPSVTRGPVPRGQMDGSPRRKPVPPPPPPPRHPTMEDPGFVPKQIRRTQTGLSQEGEAKSAADQEFEMTLQTPISGNSDTNHQNPYRTALHSPISIHPAVAPPKVQTPSTMPAISPAASDKQNPAYDMQNQPPPEAFQQRYANQGTKEAGARVMLTEVRDQQPSWNPDRLPQGPLPPPPPYRLHEHPNPQQMMPHQAMIHRKKPSLNETETMRQGAGGWL